MIIPDGGAGNNTAAFIEQTRREIGTEAVSQPPPMNYRQIGQALADHINQSSGVPTGAALQGMIADLAAGQPELLLPMRDLVSRPGFKALLTKANSGSGMLQRDALINEVRPLFSDQVLEALSELLNGFLNLQSSTKQNQPLTTRQGLNSKNQTPDQVIANATAAVAEASSAQVKLEAMLGKKGNEQEVIRLLNQALAKQQSGTAFFYRAYAKYSLGDKEGAISDYNQAIAINPQDAVIYCFRGIIKAALGDKQGAIADYTQSILISPKDADSYYNRGNVKDDLGDKQGAIADYNQAIAINPQYYAAYNNRIYVKDDLGYKQEAIAYYSQTIAINPQYADAYNNRGNAKAAQLAEKRSFSRDRWLREWHKWSLSISGLLLLGGLTGWFIGTQQFCRPLILQPGVQQLRANEPKGN